MDTRVSGHYTHDIHQPSTPDKEVNREKKNAGGEGRGGEDSKRATDSKV